MSSYIKKFISHVCNSKGTRKVYFHRWDSSRLLNRSQYISGRAAPIVDKVCISSLVCFIISFFLWFRLTRDEQRKHLNGIHGAMDICLGEEYVKRCINQVI